MMAGDLDGAIREFKSALALHPTWTWGHIKLAKAYAEKGMAEQALDQAAIAESELALGGETPLARSWLGYIYGRSGRPDRTRAALEALTAMPDADPLTLTPLYAALGDKAGVLDSLERSYEAKSVFTVWLRVVPRLYGAWIESEPRYRRILEGMNYPPL